MYCMEYFWVHHHSQEQELFLSIKKGVHSGQGKD
jgi:hypothetical protein